MSYTTPTLPPFDPSAQTTFTDMPHPEWTYGQKTETLGQDGADWVKGEEEGWKLVVAAKTEPAWVHLCSMVCLILNTFLDIFQGACKSHPVLL